MQNSLITTLNYRRDIDGLRALAVLSVVVFHAFPNFLIGGFVGVDIFFVISGYLICSIIFRNLLNENFSFIEFYSRRVRRIFPALFLVLFFTNLIGHLLLFDNELLVLNKHIVGGTLFISNFVLIKESGYFDSSAALKPLLHLWSLGVEEQFYIFFPILVYIFHKLKVSFWALTGVTLIISFVLNLFWVSEYRVWDFYSSFTRIWELLSGAIVALLMINKKYQVTSINQKHGKLIYYFGLGFLLASVTTISKDSLFPGFLVLLPVIGSCLIIFAGENTLEGKALLTNKYLVWFGLISYPLYLWHWTLLSFLNIIEDQLPNNLEKFTIVLISIFLAWGTYKLIETPIRYKIKSKFIPLALIILMIGTGFVGYQGYLSSEKLVNASNKNLVDLSTKLQKSNDLASVMLLGDSHANHLFFGLNTVLNGDIANHSKDGCIPFYDVDRWDSRSRPGDCVQKMNESIDYFISNDNFKTILISSMGPVYLTGEPFKGKDFARVTGMGMVLESDKKITDRWKIFELGMRNTLKKLSQSGKKIVFLIDIPELGIEPENCGNKDAVKNLTIFGFSFEIRNGSKPCALNRLDYDLRTERYKDLIRLVMKDYPNVILFDPTNLFCDDNSCYGEHNHQKLYKDVDHLNDFGSLYVAQDIASHIR